MQTIATPECFTLFAVDIKSDGPAPGLFSMISFGVVRVDATLDTVFKGRCCPISDQWDPESLAVTGFTRTQTYTFPDPRHELPRFAEWLAAQSQGSPVFISDNNGFDWSFMNYYLWRFLGRNPFGQSSRNLADLHRGLMRDWRVSLAGLRPAPLTHDPVDNARSHARLLLELQAQGLAIPL